MRFWLSLIICRMVVSDILVRYTKGRPPVASGEALFAYLNPEYLRHGAKPELVGKQPTGVEVFGNDIILLWDGSNAGEFFNGRKGYLSSTMVKLLLSENVNRDYAYYTFKKIEPYLKSQTSGSGIPHVDKELFLNEEIWLPDPGVQQKIAQILTTTDEAIRSTERLLAKYQDIRTGLLQDLLTRGIDEAGRVRSEETHAFKDSVLGRIPVEWEVKDLASIANVIDPQPDHRTPAYDPEGVLYIGISDIDTFGNYNRDSRRIIPVGFTKQQARFQINKGDIIFGKRGTIGATKQIQESYDVALSSNLILFQPYIDSDYVFHFTKTKCFDDQVIDHTLSTTQPAFNMGDARNILVRLPKEASEITRISAVLNEGDRNILELKVQIAKLTSLKTGLLQDLLSGNKRVDELLD